MKSDEKDLNSILPDGCPSMEDIILLAAKRLLVKTASEPAKEIGAQLVVCMTSEDDGVQVESVDIPIDNRRREFMADVGRSLAEIGFLPAYAVIVTEAWMVNKKNGEIYDEPDDTPPSQSKYRVEVINISGSDVFGNAALLAIEFSRASDGTILPINLDESELRSKIQTGGVNSLINCLFQGAGNVVRKE